MRAFSLSLSQLGNNDNNDQSQAALHQFFCGLKRRATAKEGKKATWRFLPRRQTISWGQVTIYTTRRAHPSSLASLRLCVMTPIPARLIRATPPRPNASASALAVSGDACFSFLRQSRRAVAQPVRPLSCCPVVQWFGHPTESTRRPGTAPRQKELAGCCSCSCALAATLAPAWWRSDLSFPTAQPLTARSLYRGDGFVFPQHHGMLVNSRLEYLNMDCPSLTLCTITSLEPKMVFGTRVGAIKPTFFFLTTWRAKPQAEPFLQFLCLRSRYLDISVS
ncbi:hypothetical protein B0T26DRAFT_431833 [Lasiosphaeria miniovina]|uniref:Uncharacterized protein n=1 Tax=Lasiosphaeria miniovina TaxID=1954250 RepID=A0AA40A6D0_9PEZI|nr:uncharacterized protein B0T26DRAFT_431833 [Lasiosphaeria miniovina]KAK0710082.1 hypothetical protein B0T26DRAFT_431833 [Lasiosphaeria miniovina]